LTVVVTGVIVVSAADCSSVVTVLVGHWQHHWPVKVLL